MNTFARHIFSRRNPSPNNSRRDSSTGSERKEEDSTETAYSTTHVTSAEHQQQQALEVRRAIASAQASLFGASTAEGSRAIRELSTGILHRCDSSSSASDTTRGTSASDGAAFAMSSTATVRYENNQSFSQGFPTTSSAIDATTTATAEEGGGGGDTGANSTGPLLASPMSPATMNRRERRVGRSDPSAAPPSAQGAEVLCEVSNLYYGIDVVPEGDDAAKGSAAARWWCYRGPCAARERTGDGESGARQALLQGVSCRVRAGEMVAVVVRCMHTARGYYDSFSARYSSSVSIIRVERPAAAPQVGIVSTTQR